MKSKSAQPDASPIPRESSVVVVSSDADERDSLIVILKPLRCNVYGVATCQQAVELLGRHQVCAVLSEAELADGNWRNLLRCLSPAGPPPFLIVTSRLADERLWAEVLNLGGYDLLAQPFDSQEVLRVVGLACQNYSTCVVKDQQPASARPAGRAA
jgi:DNA-binding NtrC family response regulator